MRTFLLMDDSAECLALFSGEATSKNKNASTAEGAKRGEGQSDASRRGKKGLKCSTEENSKART